VPLLGSRLRYWLCVRPLLSAHLYVVGASSSLYSQQQVFAICVSYGAQPKSLFGKGEG
jgi:hypothetical protein